MRSPGLWVLLMSSLGDRMWKEYGGDPIPNLQAFAVEKIREHGSGRAAARAMGIDEKTVRRWKSGETRGSERFDQAVKEARAANAERKTGPTEVVFKYAKRARALKFEEGRGAKGLKPGTEARVRDAYVRGDREGMAQAFLGGVQDPWYRRMMWQAYAADLDGAPGEAGETSDAVGVFA